MSNSHETFFTVIDCMDGHVQAAMASYGQKKFGSKFPDTITEAGMVGILANDSSGAFLKGLETKIMISLEKHQSVGIIIDGHEGCAGDPVDEGVQKDHIRASIEVIKRIVGSSVPVSGVYAKPGSSGEWQVEEVEPTRLA